ncbi:MAG: Asp-tRNA(Asn)/Glu-tRNA(Gln) amidotransferase subunit GatB [Candidatus Nitrotoga sp.]|nr:Asp-tRNA(Asn)/Glu-tRNA(Gln) amidotransferase subunit GatB [Candidatus Nitrotoga sp.]MBP0119191.1 Asp-tRNA(Asn)/Glu-tRNA(Gln) amidotransferase subunit GatB [Candidatus Nitrotoga sp.]
MKWEIVIGLEVHAQLSTSSKIFSGASTAFGAEANTQACAVDLALPGVLPVLNRGAVERAIKFGLAVGAHIAPRSVFSRKNYFYPDLPKGYQISQFDLPIIGHGALTICVPETTTEKAYEKLVRLTRAHLEEDAGKSLHEDFRGMTGIDLNRAGTPLLEIVSEPDMRSATEAVIYAKMLHTLVRWIGICDGNMQEGSLRFDANVSVRRPGAELGARREIKNLNSFRFLQQAIEYEAQWQIDTLEAGGKVQQATVLFDSDKCETRAMRSKEDAHDYRYFPDPDLLPVAIDADWIERVRKTLPELPLAKRARYVADLDLSAYDADTLTSSREMADLFEATLSEVPEEAKLCANWLMGDVSASLNREDRDVAHCPISPQQLGGVLKRIVDGTISNFAAKEVFKTLWSEGGDPDVIIEEKGLKQISDVGTLEAMIDKIIADNAAQVAEYRSGKEKVFGFFVGLAMKASKGSANPAQMQEILKRKLSNQK